MSTEYNVGTITISEYSTGSQNFSVIDTDNSERVRVDGTIYWTVQDNQVHWYAKCTQAYLNAYRDNQIKNYVFFGNSQEYMKLSVDGTVTQRVQVAPNMNAGVHATASGWIAENTYKNVTTGTISKNKKSSSFAVKLIIEGNGGKEASYNIIASASNAYTTSPKVTYWRDGRYVKAYLTGTTTRHIDNGDTYIYNAVLTIGSQSSSAKVVKPATLSSNTYTYTYGSSSSPIVSYETSSNTVSATLTISSSNGGKYSGTYTFTMDVPAASTLTFSQTGVSLGENLAITITRYDNTFKDTIQYIVGGNATTLVTKTTGNSYTWSPVPISLASNAPNSGTLSITIRCITYSGDTVVGQNDKTCTLTIPSSIKPTITALSITPYNTNSTVSGWGIYLQGYSQFQISVSANADNTYGATISNYKVTTTLNSDSTVVLNGASSSVTTPVITKYGSYTITAIVTDSRGHTETASATRYVYWYSKPTATNISCIRTTSSGVPAAAGTYITADGERSFSAAAGHNICTMTLSYKPTGGTYSTPSKMVDNSEDLTPLTIGGGNVLLSQTYTAKITVSDSLGNSNTYTIEIPTGFATINLKSGGTGVCFGGYSTHDNSVEIVDGWGLVTGDGINGTTLPVNGIDGQVFFERTGHAVYPHIYGNNTFGTSKEAFALTYVNNSLVTSSEMRYHAYRVGDIIFIGINFGFTNQSSSGFVTLCELPFSVLNIMYNTVPMQGDPSNAVTYYLVGDEIQAYKPNTYSGIARTSFVAVI